VAVGTDIYVLGGVSWLGGTGHVEAGVEVYNSVAEVWSTAPDMLSPRSDFATTSESGLVYAMGGLDSLGGGPMDDGEVYDPVSVSWQPIMPMPTPALDVTAETVGSLIYMASPQEGAFFVYDPSLDTWSTGPAMPLTGTLPASAVIGTEIYVYVRTSGAGRGRTVLSFDTVGQTWTLLPPKPRKVFGPGAAAAGGVFYVLGG
jgi:hypothetical protein